MVTITECADQQDHGASAGSTGASDAVDCAKSAEAGQDGNWLLNLLTCRRRRKVQGTAGRYGELLTRGRQLSEKTRGAFVEMAWWSNATTKDGARIFVLAPRGPGGDIDCSIPMWDLLAYSVSLMHEDVVEKRREYAVVWAQYSDHRLLPWTAWRFRDLLPAEYGHCLDAVHVVHPSWTVRLLRLGLWPIASDEFWDYFHSHERIEFLDTFLDIKALQLPSDLYDYDRYLDKQAAEMQEQARGQMGQRYGFTPGMFNAADGGKDGAEQLKELERLLEQKGFGHKKQD